MAPTTNFQNGFKQSIPIILGYFPVAFSFGVAATRYGFSPFEAVFLSIVVYAGASQFLALALLASGTPILISALTLLAMNIRHVLYGPALMDRVKGEKPTKFAWAWAFGLTDEVFGASISTLSKNNGRFSESWMFGIGIGAYASWVSGTAIGAYLGGSALENFPAIDAALGFMFPALFLSLLLSILTRVQMPVVIVSGIVTIALMLMVSGTWGILGGMITGALTGVFQAIWRKNLGTSA